MSQNKAQIDKLLTNASSAYIPKGFVSEMILPMIAVKQYSGKLGKYGQSYLRIENTLVGGEGKFRRVQTITRETTGYEVESHGLEGMVTKRDYANVELPFKAEEDETMGLTTSLFLGKEKSLADTLSSTSILTQNTTLSGSAQFSDYLNSDPIDKFDAARTAILDGCGELANGVIMDYKVYSKLKFHPQMLEALGFKENRPGGLSVSELAQALDVQKIFLASARYNSAKEGQTSVLSPVWGKNIIFGVFPDKAETYQTSVGYRIQIEGSQPRKVYKEKVSNPPGSMSILVEDEYDQLISNANAAYLIKDAIA